MDSHRMATQEELDADMYVSAWERECPFEAGPWSYEFEADGQTVRIGQAEPVEVEYPDRWESEFLGHQALQADMDSLDARIIKAYAAQAAAQRAERLSAIMLWVARCPDRMLRKGRRTFWLRVLESRKQCAATGLWYHVYLTKADVDSVFAAFEYRLGGGKLDEAYLDEVEPEEEEME
jgi:hypothetical protein